MALDLSILFFDGECNLCNFAVRWILAREKEDSTLYFASLQGQTGRELIEHFPELEHVDSIVFYSSGNYLLRSDAALAATRYLRGPWSWLGRLSILPKGIRDGAYRAIAVLRTTLFGKRAPGQDVCSLRAYPPRQTVRLLP